VRLGAIDFINTLPIYGPIQALLADHSGVQLHYDTPARLNTLMDAGQLDISPVSSAYYLRHQQDLVLLDNLSVSSAGAVESVLFLSPAVLDESAPVLPDDAPIYVPDSSETSIALLAHWLGPDATRRFVTYPANTVTTLLEARRHCLIIGDLALVAAHQQRTAVQQTPMQIYDLARLWHQQTGLPFVFAVWVARQHWALQNSEALAAINTLLVNAHQCFLNDADLRQQIMTTAHQRLAALGQPLPQATLAQYLTQCLYYTLGQPEAQALEKFCQILTQPALLPSTPKVFSP
jgi:chorismate dehydratase